jgi:hypothetical protein
MPQNMNELARDHGKFIEKRSFNYTKIKRNGADLHQHIWVRLCEANVLDKFAARLSSTLLHEHWSRQISTVDMCFLLGVSPESYRLWMNREVPLRDDLKWWPEPVVPVRVTANTKKILEVQGQAWFRVLTPTQQKKYMATLKVGLFSRKSIYLVSDAITIADCKPFQHYEPSVLPSWVKPSQVKSKFVGYLCQAIHNHYANFCRDHARHFTKEYVLSPDSIVQGGGHFTRRDAENGPSWEDLLPAEHSVGPEDILHLATGLREACKQNGVSPETPEGQEIIEIMASGYTMGEAIEQVGYKVTQKQIQAVQRRL